MARVSVIIPNYNHAKFLRQRIDTVLSQSMEDIEVIILDDCSSDASLTVLNDYRGHPKVMRCIVNTVNSGSTFRQWARGLEQASSDYVWIAESDDLAAPPFLATLSGVLDSYPNVGVVFCKSAHIDETNTVIPFERARPDGEMDDLWKSSFVAPGQEILRRFLLFYNVIPNASAVLFRKKFLASEVLLEAASYTLMGDWFIWSSMLLRSDLAYVDQELSAWRFHSEKGSARNIRNFNNIAEFYRIRGFLYRELRLPVVEQDFLNARLFELWMHQRASAGMTMDAPETKKVLSVAEMVDTHIYKRIESMLDGSTN